MQKRTAIFVAALLSTGLAEPTGLSAQSAELPVSVSVKSTTASSRTSSATSMESMIGRTAVTTLPGQRLPQYQTGYTRTEQTSKITNGQIDFLLSGRSVLDAVGRPLLVRLTATIDGMPFDEFRSKRSADVASGKPETVSALVKQTLEEAAANLSPQATDAIDNSADDEDADASESVPAVPSYQLTTSAAELAKRYAEATGETLNENEADWLVGHWTDGPPLLVLNAFFQSFRADQRPAFAVLDRDENGVLSAAEIEAANEAFLRCDANRDEVIDALEISRRADALRDLSIIPAEPRQLLLLVDDIEGLSQATPTEFASVKAFDADGDGAISEIESNAIRQRTPDVELHIQFDSRDATKSKITLVQLNASPESAVTVDERIEGISFRISSIPFNVTAAQQSGGNQISLGAVVDGYPLLPHLDPNDDGRITIRERRQLVDRLKAFDVDGNGEITQSEAQSPIRICVGLGPTVHNELASLRSMVVASDVSAETGPDWFVRMDRNNDNDLSRSEFPGTDEQFDSLDADSDKLISATEANAFDRNKSNE